MRKPHIFYGYWIVAVAFLCNFVTAGSVTYSFSLFLKPLQAEFSWSRGTILAALTICFVIRALALLFVGMAADRYGTRKVIALGALIFSLGFVCLSFMQNLWSLYAAYGVIGVGSAAMGAVSTTKVISNWFTKRRGLAVGIALTGIGVGGFVFAPVISAYLIPSFDWRASYLALALIPWVLIIPPALLVIKERPADIGLYPDGLEAAQAAIGASLLSGAAQGWTLGMALRTSTFWLIIVGSFAISFSAMGVVQHQVNYVTDMGFPAVVAATALGAVALGGAVSKLIFGWLCDLMPAKYAAAMGAALQLVAVITLINLKSTSPLAVIWLYAILMGLGVGYPPAIPILISANFGLASYGTIFGTLSVVQGLALGFGPLVAGQIFDFTHNYYWAFVVFVALYILAISSMLAVRRPKLPLASSDVAKNRPL